MDRDLDRSVFLCVSENGVELTEPCGAACAIRTAHRTLP